MYCIIAGSRIYRYNASQNRTMNRFKLLSICMLLVLLIVSACVRSASSGPATPTIPYATYIGTMIAKTLTAYPSSTPGAVTSQAVTPQAVTPQAASTQTIPLQAQTPQEFITSYFDGINSRNYTLTWTLLSDRFKNTLNGPAQGGYQGYVDFWNTIQKVTVLDVSPTCQGDACAVNVTLRLDYYNGQFDTSIYPYTLSYDHGRNTWLFDLLPPVPAVFPATIVPYRSQSRLWRHARSTSPASWWIMWPRAGIRSRRWQLISIRPALKSWLPTRKSPGMRPPCHPACR